ncbi:MAG: hypothetical protein H6572_12070, partial [Lewinellaceae bacterium]|nr:hypothetical protein [Lewinellaceae bacterium]
FEWLTIIDDDPDCEKFEITSTLIEFDNDDFKKFIFEIFKDDLKQILIGPTGIGMPWSDFADVCQDIENFTIPPFLDTECDNKYEAAFITMMAENKIENDYTGYCEILDWNKLLELIIDVILNVGGSESMFFYNRKAQYCFYLHYSCAVGIWYKEMNDNIRKILSYASNLDYLLKYKDLRKSNA